MSFSLPFSEACKPTQQATYSVRLVMSTLSHQGIQSSSTFMPILPGCIRSRNPSSSERALALGVKEAFGMEVLGFDVIKDSITG